MVRKLIGFSIVAASLVLGGCNSAPGGTTGKGESKPGAKSITVGLVFDKGGLGDKSFNDSANRGLLEVEKSLNVKGKTVESKSENEYQPNLEALAEQGSDLIVAVGISMKDAVEAAAKKFPNQKFAIVDASVNAPNVRSLLFKEEEGSYLAGYAAGFVTKTNKLGFVGGMDFPIIRKFQFGYQAGALAANPKVTFLPAKFTGDWVNVDLGKASAKVLFAGGADIVYHAAGRAGLGVITAATEENKFAIGVDSDQDDLSPGHVLTSMIKHVDVAVQETVKDVVDGKFTPGDKIYDLKSGGVGLSDFKNTKSLIGAENLKKLDQVRGDIIAGKIQVPSTEAEFKKLTPGSK